MPHGFVAKASLSHLFPVVLQTCVFGLRLSLDPACMSDLRSWQPRVYLIRVDLDIPSLDASTFTPTYPVKSKDLRCFCCRFQANHPRALSNVNCVRLSMGGGGGGSLPPNPLPPRLGYTTTTSVRQELHSSSMWHQCFLHIEEICAPSP